MPNCREALLPLICCYNIPLPHACWLVQFIYWGNTPADQRQPQASSSTHRARHWTNTSLEQVAALAAAMPAAAPSVAVAVADLSAVSAPPVAVASPSVHTPGIDVPMGGTAGDDAGGVQSIFSILGLNNINDIIGVQKTLQSTAMTNDLQASFGAAVRLAAYTFNQGLVDVDVLVEWVLSQLQGSCLIKELQEAALHLAGSCLEVG